MENRRRTAEPGHFLLIWNSLGIDRGRRTEHSIPADRVKRETFALRTKIKVAEAQTN